MCCAADTVAGGWCCILCWDKVGKSAGKQSTHFQIIIGICHLCRSAIMHEHVNFTQIISNRLKSRHIWKCQNMDMSKFSKSVCIEQMPRCKFQSEMAEAVKAFLAKNHRTDAP